MAHEDLEEGGSLDEAIEVPVVRDGPLPRYSADRAITAFLGRDLEIGLCVNTTRFDAEVTRVRSDSSESGIRVSGELLEIARLRMSPESGYVMALGILERLLVHGVIESDRLRTEIDSMMTQIAAKSGSPVA